MIRITDRTAVDDQSISFRFSRSAGPGGQNVNKVNTRVTLLFNVAGCAYLSDGQKRRILTRLPGRVSKDGLLRVVSQRHRTQKANRQAALERLVELLRAALEKKRARKKTSVPRAAKQKRLEEKKRRSALKQQRRKIPPGRAEG